MIRFMLFTALATSLALPALAQSDTHSDQDTLAVTEMDNPRMFRGAAPTVLRDGYQSVHWHQMTAEELTGAPVFDASDQDVGEVHSLVLSDDGTLEGAIIDVGGFLGIGEKPVLMSMDSLTIHRSDSDGSARVFVDASKDELDHMPPYE